MGKGRHRKIKDLEKELLSKQNEVKKNPISTLRYKAEWMDKSNWSYMLNFVKKLEQNVTFSQHFFNKNVKIEDVQDFIKHLANYEKESSLKDDGEVIQFSMKKNRKDMHEPKHCYMLFKSKKKYYNSEDRAYQNVCIVVSLKDFHLITAYYLTNSNQKEERNKNYVWNRNGKTPTIDIELQVLLEKNAIQKGAKAY